MSESISREAKKIEILNTAENLFAHFGLKKTSLEDIAESIGYAKTSIYYYFKSKSDIFRAVIERETDIFLKRLNNDINRYERPEDKLRTYFLTRMDYFNEQVNLKKITKKVITELLPHIDKERVRFIEAEKKIVVNILKDGIKKKVFKIKDPEFVAITMISSIKGLESSLLTYLNHNTTAADYEAILDILFNGILMERK